MVPGEQQRRGEGWSPEELPCARGRQMTGERGAGREVEEEGRVSLLERKGAENFHMEGGSIE